VTDGVTGYLISGDPSDPAVTGKFLERIGLLAADASHREKMAQAARDLAAAHDFSQVVLPIWEGAFARVGAAAPGSAAAGLIQPGTPPGQGSGQ
jgi:hypothetical protein